MTTAKSSALATLTDRPFDAVLFDNDGTLVSSLDSVAEAWLLWAKEYGIDESQLVNIHGIPAEASVLRLVGEERAPEALARIREIELNSPIPTKALPGSIDALLGTMGHNAIVTSADADLFQRRAREAGLPTPAVTVTYGDVTNGKPDPEPYLVAARRLGVDPARCLVVEDAPAGVAAGRAAGAAVLGIGGVTENALDGDDPLDADAVVPNLAAVTFSVVDGAVFVQEVVR